MPDPSSSDIWHGSSLSAGQIPGRNQLLAMPQLHGLFIAAGHM
jgi:hypothetical protein